VTLGVRRSSLMHGNSLPQAAKAQVSKPAEQGFFSYTRNWSRDKSFNLSEAPQKGDTPMFFLLRRVGHAYEVWPLIFLTALWAGVFCWYTITAFNKNEVLLDRSKNVAPWDWSRIKDKYWKMQTLMFDSTYIFGGKADTHKRLEIMETLQDEMMEAAKRRGTRN
ncbi:hypothetical protein PENTCL1PPCAC_27053, partial [Pristionchus entomophagus]